MVKVVVRILPLIIFCSVSSLLGEGIRSSGSDTLPLSNEVYGNLHSKQSHRYSLLLSANSYVRVSLSSQGTFRLNVSTEGGRNLLNTTCQSSRFHASWIAERAADYFIEISGCAPDAADRSYKLQVEVNRPANQSDFNRVAADLAIIKADALRAEGIWQSSQEALQEYEIARRIWHALRNVVEEQKALCKIGELLAELGERSTALSKFREALTISRKSNEVQQRVNALNGICAVQTAIGKYTDALASCRGALNLSQLKRYSAGEAAAHQNLGVAYYDLGEFGRAIQHLNKALDLYGITHDRAGEARSLHSLASITLVLGQIQDSQTKQQQALSIFQSLNDRSGQAQSLTALGHLHAVIGDEQKAIENYGNALQLAETLRNLEVMAQACSGMGFVFYQLGQFERALGYRQRALELYRAMPDLWGESSLQMSIGKVYYAMGDNERALKHYEDGLVVARQLANLHLQSALTAEIGSIYKSLGQFDKALKQYGKSLALSRLGMDPRDEADALNRIGETHANLRRSQLALTYFRRALALARSVTDRSTETQTLLRIARTQTGVGKLTEAKATIETALSIIETLRTNVSQELRSSYFATVRSHYELKVRILMELHKRNPHARFDVSALEIGERARARSLLETLTESRADIREGVDPTLLQRADTIERQLNIKAEQRAQLLAARRRDEAQLLSKEIEQLTIESENVKFQIREKSPRYSTLIQPQPLAVAEIQRTLLDYDSVLLEFMLCDERSYLWAVTRTDISSYELPGRAQIEDAALRFYKLLTANQAVAGETFEQRKARVAEANATLSREAASFSKLLLGPVVSSLGNKRLIIVPDGALQYIPFQALTVPAPGNQNLAPDQPQPQVPLVVDHEIINEPSASALAFVMTDRPRRRSVPNSIAVFANPVFEPDDPRVNSRASKPSVSDAEAWAVAQSSSLPESAGLFENDAPMLAEKNKVHQAFRDAGLGESSQIAPLPGSREEAEAIISVVPWRSGLMAVGFDASRATITRTDLSRYRIVHFATHAFVDYEHPELSGLVLSLVDEHGRPQQGYLRMQDIYNMKLPVDLVVLSACNTALGKDVKGEGLIGLTRGFMYAGAGAVAASLWKVDDEATAELMKRFYNGMFRNGLTPAAALQQAQVAMWKQSRWHEPYYWAAFVIQGQYNQKVNTGNAKTPTFESLAAIGTLVCLSLAGFFYLRRRWRKAL